MNLTFRKYVERNIKVVSKKYGIFTFRLESLGKEIAKCFTQWNTLTDSEKENFYKNTKCIVNTIIVHKQTDDVKRVSSLAFMQHQGNSHYCSVCAFNNLVGKEATTPHEMNHVGDDLWLRNFDDLQQSVRDGVQPHRDPNGFHSIDTMIAVGKSHGYCLCKLNEQIQSCQCQILAESPQQLLHDLLQCYKPPAMLLILNNEDKHYTAIRVYHKNVWCFDSLQRRPKIITADHLRMQEMQ